MSDSESLLALDIRLLLLRYGRTRVLHALASLSSQTQEELERDIAAAQDRKTKKKSKSSPTSDLVASTFRDRPELVPIVQQLVTRYENRMFLPQLRDVQRFLDRTTGSHVRLKSRKAAIGPLLRAMAKMSAEDVSRLTGVAETRGDSDFALLARAIMTGTGERKR